MKQTPPFTVTTAIISLVSEVSEAIGRFSAQEEREQEIRLRKVNRVRTIQGSLAIEGNTLSEEQITAILNGKRVIAPPREVKEAHNAIQVYERFLKWNYRSEKDLLAAHKILMLGLTDDAGRYRRAGVGVMKGDAVIHMAPPADRVPLLMGQLLDWIGTSQVHPLISSSIFHYEFEFIHPFSDGNGRLGRLWQSLILNAWNPIFEHLPIESMIYDHQNDYYVALNQSTQQTDSAPFIEFILLMIRDILKENLELTHESPPQVTPQVTPQVKNLLEALGGETLLRGEIQQKLGLKDRKSFTERYLKPALKQHLIEMTLPNKPTSRLQRYRLTERGGRIRDL